MGKIPARYFRCIFITGIISMGIFSLIFKRDNFLRGFFQRNILLVCVFMEDNIHQEFFQGNIFLGFFKKDNFI